MGNPRTLIQNSRKERRYLALLRVKVHFEEPNASPALACTYEISRYGVRMARIRGIENKAQYVWLERGTRRAKYKVIWLGARGSILEDQVGLELMDIDIVIWEESVCEKLAIIRRQVIPGPNL